MKGIVITTDLEVSVQDFEKPLYQTVGKAVGGYIEHVKPRYLPDPFCMIVNEEGILEQLRPNPVGCSLYGTIEHGHTIVGTIVLMKDGYWEGEPDIVGLDENEISGLLEFLRNVFHIGLKGSNEK